MMFALIYVSLVLGDTETRFIISKTVKYLHGPVVVFVILRVDVPRLFHSIWSSEARIFLKNVAD